MGMDFRRLDELTAIQGNFTDVLLACRLDGGTADRLRQLDRDYQRVREARGEEIRTLNA